MNDKPAPPRAAAEWSAELGSARVEAVLADRNSKLDEERKQRLTIFT